MYADNSTSALLFLLISVVVSWLVIYTAVAAGVGPALDVTARWSTAPVGEVLARARLLGPNGRIEWALAATPIPDELQSIRTLTVDWANGIDPSAGRKFKQLAVLVPSQLGAAH